MSHSVATKRRLRWLAYLAGFSLALASALSAYINSSFIEEFVGASRVGWVYSSEALLSLTLSWISLALARRSAGQPSTIALAALASGVSLGGVIIFQHTPLALVCLVASIICNYLAAIHLDVYLESLSTDSATGGIRGLFLTAINLAWLASPWLSSNLAESLGYTSVYSAALGALLPGVLIIAFGLRHTNGRVGPRLSLRAGLARLQREINLRRLITLDFLLNFFYAVMVIYMPLYLREVIGLSWPQIGLAFTVMLLPFVLLQLPLGRVADRWWGEKELLALGLLLIVLACLMVAPIATPSLLLWMAVLLLSRIGAATVEVMKETYLFKYIDGQDANIVFISRNMYPVAYILGPLTASLFLLYFPLASLFTLLAAIMLIGLPIAIKLKDTK